uniref:Uncharacterized protein n=1 Tax=Electrophorus electricus TaxID=8005 RepID=A0A4W4FEN6_ELEEL
FLLLSSFLPFITRFFCYPLLSLLVISAGISCHLQTHFSLSPPLSFLTAIQSGVSYRVFFLVAIFLHLSSASHRRQS